MQNSDLSEAEVTETIRQTDVSKLNRETSPISTSDEIPRAELALPTITLEREVQSRKHMLFYVVVFISLDLSKMLSSYALQYYNNDKYPIKQTLVVFATELMKLMLMLVQMTNDGSLKETKLSILFAIPSIIYAVNNNLLLYAFYYTSPAVWSILMQSRVIMTALVYRLFFKREVTRLQWFALTLLCLAIIVTKIGGDSGSLFVKPMAFVIAAFVSVLSVAAALIMEYLFKNDKRSFAEQQFQLYLYASVFAFVLYLIELGSNGTSPQTENIDSDRMAGLLLFTVQLGALSGLVTATVIKKLDNIVKIYSQSLTGVMNAVLSAYLFPRKFAPDSKYIISLVLVITAIVLYERKHLKPEHPKEASIKVSG